MKKSGIICAGDDELKPFLSDLKKIKITEKAMLTFYEGELDGFPAVTLYSGVGKVNAAVAAQVLIDFYGVDFIVNAGTCGGMAENIGIFDTIITEKCAYHDMEEDILTEFHPFLHDIYFKSDAALLKAAGSIAVNDASVYTGITVTGEQFIDNRSRGGINAKFSPLSVDMETAAIAQVCHANKVPFIAVRTVTDNPANDGADNFEANCLKASEISKNFVKKLLAKVC